MKLLGWVYKSNPAYKISLTRACQQLNNHFMSFVIIIINPEFKVLENTFIKQITRSFVYLGVFIREGGAGGAEAI